MITSRWAGNVAFPIFVVGGPGDDQIKAGRGRSILFGGTGADRLIGGQDQEILVDGTTDFDQDPRALGDFCQFGFERGGLTLEGQLGKLGRDIIFSI